MQTEATQTALDTPLAAIHRDAGAKLGVWFGCTLPSEFADWRSEYAFARNSAALIDKNYRAYLSLTGPDRVRYLNAILTNNIKNLRAGQGNVSLLLNPQGHILAEIETYALPDSLFCVSYAMIRTRLMGVIEKYIIMDDVTLTDQTDRFATLALEGPSTPDIVREVSSVEIANLDELSFCDGSVSSIPCRIVKRSPGGVAGAELIVERDKVVSLWQILLAAVRKHGGGPMGYVALNALRLEMGLPWFGYDFGEKQIPHEAGLQDSHINYTKGCYTGQEIVERVRSRGHVNKHRVELIFSGEAVPEAGTLLTLDGKEMGSITRAAQVLEPPRILGMGYVRKEGSAVGTILQWAGGTAAVVRFSS